MAPDTSSTKPLPRSLEAPLSAGRKAVGFGMLDCVDQPDMRRLRAYRLERVRAELRKRDYAGALLYDPLPAIVTVPGLVGW